MSFSLMESIFNDRTARYWNDFHSDKFESIIKFHLFVLFILTVISLFLEISGSTLYSDGLYQIKALYLIHLSAESVRNRPVSP